MRTSRAVVAVAVHTMSGCRSGRRDTQLVRCIVLTERVIAFAPPLLGGVGRLPSSPSPFCICLLRAALRRTAQRSRQPIRHERLDTNACQYRSISISGSAAMYLLFGPLVFVGRLVRSHATVWARGGDAWPRVACHPRPSTQSLPRYLENTSSIVAARRFPAK